MLTDVAGAPPRVRSLVRGEWIDGNGSAVSVRDPATGDEASRLACAAPEDVERAVAAAREAQRGWAGTPARERGDVLFRAAEEIERRRNELARLITAEMGKVLRESRDEVDEAAFFLRFMAGEGARLVGETRPSADADRFAFAERAPAGVVGVITPWNFPLCIPAWKLASALVAGNAIVFKPALQTAGTGARLVEALCAAGLPEGVLNLVIGEGAVAGDALARHPDVRVLAFTGSTTVGHELGALVGGRGARAALELGGKNVAAVLADADLEHAAEQIALGAFATTGQRCTATSRVVVDERVHDELVECLSERAERLAVGPGSEPESDVGPLVSADSRERVTAAVAQAVAGGGRLAAGGEAPPDLPAAAGYYRPTVVTDVSPSHTLVRRELFGPVTAVVRARGERELVRLANDTDYGLAAAVFTADAGRGLACARALEAGMVFVNAATVGAESQLPFGGIKASGNGSRDTGLAALDSYTEWRSVYVSSSQGTHYQREH